jgi:hypothetical protein
MPPQHAESWLQSLRPTLAGKSLGFLFCAVAIGLGYFGLGSVLPQQLVLWDRLRHLKEVGNP